jgi:hypothetical protein
MKNFSKFNESYQDHQMAAHLKSGDDGVNDIANPKTIDRINSFLGAMGQMEYLMPEHALNIVRDRLEKLGLTFGDVTLSEAGKQSMPMTQYGGRFGKDGNGDDINDDGISHKVEGGLSLEIEHVITNGSHFVKTKIV